MCCLKYEYEDYRKFIENAPERGYKVKCSYGCGVVIGYEPLKESLILAFENDSIKSVPLCEVEVTNERVEIADDKSGIIPGEKEDI